MILYKTYDKYLTHILDRYFMIYTHNFNIILFSRINNNVNVYTFVGNFTSDPKRNKFKQTHINHVLILYYPYIGVVLENKTAGMCLFFIILNNKYSTKI